MNLSDHRRVDARNWQNEPDGMSNVTRSHFWPNEPKRHPPTYKFWQNEPKGSQAVGWFEERTRQPDYARRRDFGRTNPTAACWQNEPDEPNAVSEG